MENKHASNGMAEDVIRSFVQIASTELHTKTMIEKNLSELENGMVEDDKINEHLDNLSALREDLEEQAELRRSSMLYLYNLYGAKGEKSYWCTVKHLSMAMYTMFEAYQASNKDEELFDLYIKANKQFIKAVSKFLGVSITECASCFSDILKAEV